MWKSYAFKPNENKNSHYLEVKNLNKIQCIENSWCVCCLGYIWRRKEKTAIEQTQ